jgi:hypothetical protein
MNKEDSFRNSTCEDQINMAERELSAFIRAVTELFGQEQARLSTEDWLDELELMDRPPGATSRDWRAITVAASAWTCSRSFAVKAAAPDVIPKRDECPRHQE